MYFRKTICILLVFVLLLGFSACGTRQTDNENENSKKVSANDDSTPKPTPTTSSETQSTANAAQETHNNSNNVNKDIESDPFADRPLAQLPKDFPSDIFPMFKESKLLFAIEENRDGRLIYQLISGCYAKREDVFSFYSNLLKDTQNKRDDKSTDAFIFGGTIESMDFELVILSEPNTENACQLTLNVSVPPTKGDALNSLEATDIPETYPQDKFPLVKDACVTEAEESESDGVKSYYLRVYTTMSFKEIVAFYEENLSDLADKDKSISSDDFAISGVSNGFYVNICGYQHDVNGIDLTTYSVELAPAE